MKPFNRVGAILLATVISVPSQAQVKEIRNLFGQFETAASRGTPLSFDEADPILERIPDASRDDVAGAIPLIVREAGNPSVSVRRLAAMMLYKISTRPDGETLLSGETSTLSALLIDADIPIRAVTGLAINSLRPSASSPLVATLKAYLDRDDAVATVGVGVATTLMQVAPDSPDSTAAVVRYMRRRDQISRSRIDLLNAIEHVAKSRNREIGKEVARYADDPDEEVSLCAIQTLQGMGKFVIRDNRETMLRIAGDSHRGPRVHAAVAAALSSVP